MNLVIEEKKTHKDLGVLMSRSGDFKEHIDFVIKKVRKLIGWVCRTFSSRNISFMRQIYVSILRPHIDYCSQLWGPGEGPQLDRLEKLQSYFTRLVPSIRNLTYTERLREMNISSIQRRFDRYRIIYVRKILLNLVPNPGISIRRESHERQGIQFEVNTMRTDPKLKSDSFLIRGPLTYNSLPEDLRSLNESIDSFKKNLDEFLRIIPDCPRIDCGGSNLLNEQIKKWVWKLRYTVTGHYSLVISAMS